jgi:hypothetical protein
MNGMVETAREVMVVVVVVVVVVGCLGEGLGLPVG